MEVIQTIALYFLISGIIFLAIMIFRNNLVYNARTRALDVSSEKAKKTIGNQDYDWMRFYRVLDNLSYNKMFWDFRKWSYESFYDFVEDME